MKVIHFQWKNVRFGWYAGISIIEFITFYNEGKLKAKPKAAAKFENICMYTGRNLVHIYKLALILFR